MLAGIGIALGLVIGQAAPWLLSAAAGHLLPIRLALDFYPLPLLIAAACGLLTALVFAIWPLARARQVSPAGMFRALVVPPDRLPPWAALVGLGLSLIALGALAVVGVADRRLGAIFVARGRRRGRPAGRSRLPVPCRHPSDRPARQRPACGSRSRICTARAPARPA